MKIATKNANTAVSLRILKLIEIVFTNIYIYIYLEKTLLIIYMNIKYICICYICYSNSNMYHMLMTNSNYKTTT